MNDADERERESFATVCYTTRKTCDAVFPINFRSCTSLVL